MSEPEKNNLGHQSLLQQPANISEAELHNEATKVRILSYGQADPDKTCKCCSMSSSFSLFPLNCDLISLGELGVGFPLYFYTIKAFLVIIFLGGLICGIPCASFNYSHSKSLKRKPSNWASESSIHHGEDPIWQGILYFLYSIVVLIGIIYFRKFIRGKIVEIDKLNVTPSDFTVVVKGISNYSDEKAIIDFMQNKTKPFNEYAEVVEVSRSYNITQYVGRIKKIKKLKAQITQMEMSGEKKSRISCLGRRQNKQEIKKKIEELEKWKIEFEQSGNLQFEQGNWIFVTFRKQTDSKEIMDYWQEKEVEKFSRILTCCLHQYIYSERRFEGRMIKIEPAPEPSDIIWENLTVGFWVRLTKKFKTLIVTLALIGLSFFVVLSIKIYEYNVYADSGKKHISNTENIKIKMISYMLSASIVVLNQIIGYFIRYFSRYEKPHTWTNYNVSVFHKLVLSTTVNTIGLLVLINSYDIQKGYTGAKGIHIHWFSNDYGLPTDISSLLMIDAFVVPLILVFNPVYLLNLWKRKKVIDGKLFLTQYQANLLWTNPEMDVAQRLARYVRTFLVVLFFSPIFPMGLLLGVVCISIQYWTDKYLLLRRYCRPKTYGKDMTIAVIRWLPVCLLCFTVSNFSVQYIFHEGSSRYFMAPLIGVFIAVLYFFVPFRKIFGKSIEAEETIDFQLSKDENDFNVQNLGFYDDYRRSNPVTSKEAWKKWLDELEKTKGVDIRNQFQLKFGKNIVNAGIFNYADSRPSSNHLNGMGSGYTYVDPNRFSRDSQTAEAVNLLPRADPAGSAPLGNRLNYGAPMPIEPQIVNTTGQGYRPEVNQYPGNQGYYPHANPMNNVPVQPGGYGVPQNYYAGSNTYQQPPIYPPPYNQPLPHAGTQQYPYPNPQNYPPGGNPGYYPYNYK